MKNIPVILIALLSVFSCSKQITPTAETTYLTSKDGVLNLRSTGYCNLKSYKDECIDSAQINAFRTLFYRGIPGSQQNTPLIGIDERNKTGNDKFLKDFFTSGRYKTFIVSSSTVSDLTKQRNQKKIMVDMGINLSALRKELEQNTVIQKFGY
jgi:hypothetical protein